MLITLDTTIPEALSCYGLTHGSTPNLDRLAREGVRYTRARSVAPMTMPAHASMMTGLYPLRHSVRINGSMILPDEAVTVAERAREAGWQTAAFVAAVVLDGEMGIAQGFETYDAPQTPASVSEHLAARRPAAEVVDRAVRWLRGRDRDRPFFLWVHLFDPHAPYEPPEAWRERAGGNPYYGAVGYMDSQIGRLLDALQVDGASEHALTIAVADHGEALGRHGESTHMTCAFDATLAVPLLVRFPDRRRAGEVSDATVSVVDVGPTILAALGLAAPRDADGLDLGAGDPPAERGVYFETYYGYHAFGWSQLVGWADGRGKYLHSKRCEFYDTRADPGEERDRIAEVDVAPYRRSIAELGARPRLDAEGLGEAFGGLRGQIEKLGYAGSGATPEELPEPLEPSPGPSPHDRIEAFARFLEAQKLSTEKRASEAIALLRPLLAENPRHYQAAFLLGLNLMELGRYEEAIAPLRQALANRGRGRIGADLNLALCYQRTGRVEEAIAMYEEALEHTDGPPGALALFVGFLEEQGRTELAERWRRRLRE